jgi:hypothetical protein
MRSAESVNRTSDPGHDDYDDATECLLHSQEMKSRRKQKIPWFSGKNAIAIHACVFVFYLMTTIGLGVALGVALRRAAKMNREILHCEFYFLGQRSGVKCLTAMACCSTRKRGYRMERPRVQLRKWTAWRLHWPPSTSFGKGLERSSQA